MVKAVIFDIGNVLLEWHPDKVYGGLIPDPVLRRRSMPRPRTFRTTEILSALGTTVGSKWRSRLFRSLGTFCAV